MSTIDYEKIAKDILKQNLSGNSQTKIADILGVSRHAVRKALTLSLTSDQSEVIVEDSLTSDDETIIATTENGCVSYTPSGSAPVSVGDICQWGKTAITGLIVDVDMETKTISYIEIGEIGVPNAKISSCFFKNWKKRKARNNGVNHQFIYTQDIAKANGECGQTLARSIGNGEVTWYEKYKGLYDSDAVLISTASSDNYSSDAVVDSEDDVVSAHDADQDTVKKLRGDNCPYRLAVSTRSVTIIVDGETFVITSDEGERFKDAIKLAQDKDWENLLVLCQARSRAAVNANAIMSKFGFEVQQGFVVMGDKTRQMKLGGVDVLMRRVDSYAKSGDIDGVTAMSKFIDKLIDNPNPEIMNRVIDFIRFGDVEVDSEGYVIAYKYVESNYKDSHSRRLDNRVGCVVKMRRALVDANINSECSQGLHVCALSYVFSFWSTGKRLVKVRLNPRDIVAIPKDYKGAKIRCCEYTVIEDVTSKFLQRKIPIDFKGVFKGV